MEETQLFIFDKDILYIFIVITVLFGLLILFSVKDWSIEGKEIPKELDQVVTIEALSPLSDCVKQWFQQNNISPDDVDPAINNRQGRGDSGQNIVSQQRFEFFPDPNLMAGNKIINKTIATRQYTEMDPNMEAGFCSYFKGNSGLLNKACNRLTKGNCNLTDCCVYVNNNKCSAGNVDGPTFNTDENGNLITLDTYYFRNRCYGPKCPEALAREEKARLDRIALLKYRLARNRAQVEANLPDESEEAANEQEIANPNLIRMRIMRARMIRARQQQQELPEPENTDCGPMSVLYI